MAHTAELRVALVKGYKSLTAGSFTVHDFPASKTKKLRDWCMGMRCAHLVLGAAQRAADAGAHAGHDNATGDTASRGLARADRFAMEPRAAGTA